MRLFSWNVNGLRSVESKGLLDVFFTTNTPDIACFQEIKMDEGQAEVFREKYADYEQYYSFADRRGYSGTAVWVSKTAGSIASLPQVLSGAGGSSPAAFRAFGWQESSFQPQPRGSEVISASSSPYLTDGLHALRVQGLQGLSLQDEFGDATREGRMLALDLGGFFLVNVYSPHTKRELERLPLKRKWDEALVEYVKELEQTKPVLVCGDLNIAHEEIDIANPKQNEKNAGFTAEERADFDEFVAAGLVDTFRALHPDETGAYTWWTWRANARARNIGWRIDYFLASAGLMKEVTAAAVHQEVVGSDHCPVSIDLKI